MRIELNRSACIGNGMCCAVAPRYFELDQQGELTVLHDQVDDGDEAVVEDAAASCPVGAIILHRADTGR